MQIQRESLRLGLDFEVQIGEFLCMRRDNL